MTDQKRLILLQVIDDHGAGYFECVATLVLFTFQNFVLNRSHRTFNFIFDTNPIWQRALPVLRLIENYEFRNPLDIVERKWRDR